MYFAVNSRSILGWIVEFQFSTHAWTRVLENTPKRVYRRRKIPSKRVGPRGSLFLGKHPFHAFLGYKLPFSRVFFLEGWGLRTLKQYLFRKNAFYSISFSKSIFKWKQNWDIKFRCKDLRKKYPFHTFSSKFEKKLPFFLF